MTDESAGLENAGLAMRVKVRKLQLNKARSPLCYPVR